MSETPELEIARQISVRNISESESVTDPIEKEFVENMQKEHRQSLLNANNEDIMTRTRGKRVSQDSNFVIKDGSAVLLKPPADLLNIKSVPSCESLNSYGSITKSEIDLVESLQRDHYQLTKMVAANSDHRRKSTENTQVPLTVDGDKSPDYMESDIEGEELIELSPAQIEKAVTIQPRRRSVSKDRVKLSEKLAALASEV